MPRDLPIGNGNLLIAFDPNYNLRELYYPYVGQENHTAGAAFRFGVWADGKFSWIGGDGWERRLNYLEDTLVTDVALENRELGLRLFVNDLVDFHENLYLRRLRLENAGDKAKELRVFFHHDFSIYGNDIGDTAAYRPEVKGLLHYKGERYFLINARLGETAGIADYATGNKDKPQTQGTWRDAEDGVLGQNPIAQGSVDSVAALHLSLPAGARETLFYWICVGQSWEEVSRLNQLVLGKTPEIILRRTRDYWRLWVNKGPLTHASLPPAIFRLYKRSLLIGRTQIDNRGGILAANDSDVMHFNRDTYSYVWPRDGSLTAYALDAAGYAGLARNYFEFCARIIRPEGYFLHKYTPNGDPGSSWHPWVQPAPGELPIQEDETALVIWALWHHFRRNRDIEFIKPLYKPLVKNAADFLMRYRDARTGLPLPSYDLWEERRGVLTFTASAVYAGLKAAADFTEAFGEKELSEQYLRGAEEIRTALGELLYRPQEKRFARMVNFKPDGTPEWDLTLDASLHAVCAFGVFPADDERVVGTLQQVHDRLWCRTKVGGLARYENDYYYRASQDVPGNPWFICTLWLAQYHIARAKKPVDLQPALELLEWTAAHALPSGVLAEQVHPYSNAALSVSPLTWSHATLIATVREYLSRQSYLQTCPTCQQPKKHSVNEIFPKLGEM